MEKKKRRFVTIELCPCLSDEQEVKVKESIAQSLIDLHLREDNAALFIPKSVLMTKFDKNSDIVVVRNNIVVPT